VLSNISNTHTQEIITMAGKTKDVLKDPAAWRAWAASQIQKEGPPKKKKSVLDRLRAIQEEADAREAFAIKEMGIKPEDLYYSETREQADRVTGLEKQYRDAIGMEFGVTAADKLRSGVQGDYPALLEVDGVKGWGKRIKGDKGFSMRLLTPEEHEAWENQLEADRLKDRPWSNDDDLDPKMREEAARFLEGDLPENNTRGPESSKDLAARISKPKVTVVITNDKPASMREKGLALVDALFGGNKKEPTVFDQPPKEKATSESVDLPDEAGSATTASYRKAGAARLKGK
jgi:hypothetical protein